jgi:hypothetical protein
VQLSPRAKSLAGFLASGLWFGNLHIAGYTATPSPTLLLLFLVAFGVWSFVRVESGRLSPLFVVAAVVGVYTQAAFFVIAFAIVFWALLVFWRSRQLSWMVGAVLIAAGAVSKPAASFLIDRTRETHSTEPPSAVLWEANNPYYTSMTAFSLWERRPGNHWSKWKVTEAETAAYKDYFQRAGGNGTRAALLWMRENPRDYFELCIVRFGAVLGPVTGQMSPLLKKISTLTWLIVFPAGFLGVWKLRGTRFSGLFACALLFQVAFESLVIAGWQPRYRLPLDLLLFIGAGVCYAMVLSRTASTGAKTA